LLALHVSDAAWLPPFTNSEISSEPGAATASGATTPVSTMWLNAVVDSATVLVSRLHETPPGRMTANVANHVTRSALVADSDSAVSLVDARSSGKGQLRASEVELSGSRYHNSKEKPPGAAPHASAANPATERYTLSAVTCVVTDELQVAPL
jgi:hypothetical protein